MAISGEGSKSGYILFKTVRGVIYERMQPAVHADAISKDMASAQARWHKSGWAYVHYTLAPAFRAWVRAQVDEQ